VVFVSQTTAFVIVKNIYKMMCSEFDIVNPFTISLGLFHTELKSNCTIQKRLITHTHTNCARPPTQSALEP
jgi:hypothetical protein